MKLFNHLTKNKGFATALAIYILFILLGLTLVFSEIMLSEIVVAGNFLREAKLFAAAEYGIAYAVEKLYNKMKTNRALQISEVMSNPPTGTTPLVRINEIRTQSGTQEFVELIGITGINLQNYKIIHYNQDAALQFTHTIAAFTIPND
ncbi:MAG: hypothetical protein AB1765_12920, partial [Candidatus Hydrogenedentota bacterium]